MRFIKKFNFNKVLYMFQIICTKILILYAIWELLLK